ncbi:helix-turn-helix transcriptional regulator [Pseudomonas sp. GOM6]|uniref:helix-turn-helix domain-containing protein n=1 Tax=Pseudomonas sp. GOM6 TaxID=3036944 RepID=UPI002408F5D6|nr:helix-turn-helix transcriptional regulator [Pseudomonas sp. GOM6]MDG1580965.1 helix-turn-helix transcriptional regulator [Pseudomonas sp. GOM6]
MSISEPSDVSIRLIETAQARGIPRRGLTRRLAALCAVTDHAAHKWVTGESEPSRRNAEKIAAAWGVTVAYLLFGETVEAMEAAKTNEVALPLLSINQLHRAGSLDDQDLVEIERFARLLASKNVHQGAR